MPDLLYRPWPWYVTGPLVGLVATGLLVIGNKQLGVSSNFRHLCAAAWPRNVSFFKYDWTRSGLWNLVFAGGGFLIGFGTAYAGGCTSGHGITGLADLQLPSLIAVVAFFAAGAVASHFLLPLLLSG